MGIAQRIADIGRQQHQEMRRGDACLQVGRGFQLECNIKIDIDRRGRCIWKSAGGALPDHRSLGEAPVALAGGSSHLTTDLGDIGKGGELRMDVGEIIVERIGVHVFLGKMPGSGGRRLPWRYRPDASFD